MKQVLILLSAVLALLIWASACSQGRTDTSVEVPYMEVMCTH
jgi:hypothetical protein